MALKNKFNPEEYTAEELRQLYSYLDGVLGSGATNVEKELERHYLKCREASDMALENMKLGENVGSAGSLLNAATTSLKELAKLQIEINEAERVKALQRVIVKLIKDSDNPERYFALLEKELKAVR